MAGSQAFGFIAVAAILCCCLAPLSAGEDDQDDYELFVTVDDTKVSIESGNITVAVTRDWPRIVFWHSVDPFSPTFDIGFPKLFLFNDTNGDGRFCRSEGIYTVYLDSNHVEWNLSSVETMYAPGLEQYVEFSMTATVSAYNSTLDAPPCVESWANVTFWYRLAENDTHYENPVGLHMVMGRSEVLVNMTVTVTNRTSFDCLAIERFLQGGGTTNMFEVLEDGPDTEVTAVVSGREDETLNGDEFTRPMNGTGNPTQSIRFAKEDGTVQAFFHWGSMATDTGPDASSGIVVNSSCYTTGTGLILDSALQLSNGTIAFSLDSSLGIVESGFVGRMTDWVKEHSVVLAEFVAIIAIVVAATSYLVLRKRRRRAERPGDEKPGSPP